MRKATQNCCTVKKIRYKNRIPRPFSRYEPKKKKERMRRELRVAKYVKGNVLEGRQKVWWGIKKKVGTTYKPTAA